MKKIQAIFEIKYTIEDVDIFKLKAIQSLPPKQNFVFLNNNNYSISPNDFEFILAFGGQIVDYEVSKSVFEDVQKSLDESKSWLFGFLGYDLKNQIEDLSSTNIDQILNKDISFFQPDQVLLYKNNPTKKNSSTNNGELAWTNFLHEMNCVEVKERGKNGADSLVFKQNMTKKEYLDKVRKIQNHIYEGDIYELNLCIEFYCKNAKIDPLETYRALHENSPMPFECLARFDDLFIISASPERFLKKQGSTLTSQPMKGTAKRSMDPIEDEKLKSNLYNDEKERAENMMIVDLVRNDLARSAQAGSVKVEELFGIYTFKNLHQMISTVSAQKLKNVSTMDCVKHAFPMGSMTGAPKLRAMQLIEELENSRRGLFSGAFGYFTPTQDFDLNVMIRTILYNQKSGVISFQAGSAITWDSIPEKEYEECMLKAEALLSALNATIE